MINIGNPKKHGFIGIDANFNTQGQENYIILIIYYYIWYMLS